MKLCSAFVQKPAMQRLLDIACRLFRSAKNFLYHLCKCTEDCVSVVAVGVYVCSELSIRGRHNAPASNSASQPSQLAAASKLSGARTAQSESLAVLQMQVMSDKLQGALRQLHEERLARHVQAY